MSLKEINKKFLNIEDGLDLFDRKINGVYFWERIRMRVYTYILEECGTVGQAYPTIKTTYTKRVKKAVRLIKDFLSPSSHFISQKEILFWGAHRRKIQMDEKWWDIYCDPIIENLNRPYLYIESYYLGNHLVPARTENIHYLDFLYDLAAIRCKLGTVRVSFTREEKALLKDILHEIYDKLKVRISLEDMVRIDLLIRESRLPLYTTLLTKVNPRIVIVVCSYGKETFIEACKNLNIPVVELQHGVINEYHLGYAYPGVRRIKRTFPDYFFAFGDFWKDSVEFPIGKDRIFSVGYPYLEREVEKYINVQKKEQLLFISQGTIGKELSKFAVELSKTNQISQKIIYKLHPGEYDRWQREYPWLEDAEIEVLDDDRIPLYRLFAESKIQIGVYSTSVYEGLAFGNKTYLFNLPGIEYMEYLIKNQYAKVVFSIDELIALIKEEKYDKHFNIKDFFRSNALNNIYNKLGELITSQLCLK